VGAAAAAGAGGIVPRFFFDRNLGRRVPRALAAAGWAAEVHDDHFPQETPDTELLQFVAARGWVFVTQDKKIRQRGPERAALREHGVAAVFVSASAQLTSDQTAAALSAAASEIRRQVEILTPPFILTVRRDGTTRVLHPPWDERPDLRR